MMMKGYKVFNSDWTCRGFQYEVGKEFTMNEKPEACSKGFHFCKNVIDCFNYYDFDSKNKVAEVETLGELDTDDNKKFCTNHIKIVRELNWHEVLELVNTGKDCTGKENSGDRNSGDWNSTNHSSGCFCTERHDILFFDKPTNITYEAWRNSDAYHILGDMPSTKWFSWEDMTEGEKASCKATYPEAETMGGYLKKATEADKQNWYDNLSDFYKQKILEMPNFDADKFYLCTGIRVEEK